MNGSISCVTKGSILCHVVGECGAEVPVAGLFSRFDARLNSNGGGAKEWVMPGFWAGRSRQGSLDGLAAVK